MLFLGQASSLFSLRVFCSRGFLGSTNNWWERSPNSSNSTNFCNVNTNGNANNNNASNSNGVSFGFCGT